MNSRAVVTDCPAILIKNFKGEKKCVRKFCQLF